MLSVNGAPVQSAIIRFSLRGATQWDLVLGGNEAPTGALVAETDAGEVFHLTAKTSGRDPNGVIRVRAFGGGAGLDTMIESTHFVGGSRGSTLQKLLAQGNETLSSTSDDLSDELPHFVKYEQTLQETLVALCPDGWSFRSLPDGSIWFGKETWPTSKYEEEPNGYDEREQVFTVQPPSMKIFPGEVYREKKLTEVLYTLGPTGWTVQASYRAGLGGLLGQLSTFVARAQNPCLETSLYEVVTQNGDGTLDLRPIGDEKDPPLQRISIFMGAGLTKIEVSPGTKAHVTYENGSPYSPVVTAFELKSAKLLRFDADAIEMGGSVSLVEEPALLQWITTSLIPALATASPVKTVDPPQNIGTDILKGD